MSTSLSLFPARIRFVNQDGTLTPEAYRAMQMLYGRVGGTFGDQGTDTFAVVASGADDVATDVMAQETVVQPVMQGDSFADVAQPASVENIVPEVFQPVQDKSMTAAESVTPGASPYTYTAKKDGYLIVRSGTVSQIDYVRNGVDSTIGATSGFFPVLAGDGIKVTYTVAPTMTFIPR